MRRDAVWALWRRDRAGEDALIFMHIPRTGGKSLGAIMARQYPARQIGWLDLNDPVAAITAFKARSPDEKARVRLLRGHVWYGAHRLLPGPARYVTLLREPVARTLSLYHYTRHYPDPVHPGRTIDRGDEMGRDLRTFLERAVWGTYLDNAQTRFISGDMTAPIGGCGPEMLSRAKANIERHFTLVGLTERFDESLLLLVGDRGWRFPYYARINVGHAGTERAAISPGAEELLQTYNRWDEELYAYAAGLLEARLAAQPAAFAGRLRRLRRGNALFEWLYRRLRS